MSTPCFVDAELWFSLAEEDRALAMDSCLDCPVMFACLAGAEERDERWGVWGGEDFGAKRGGRVPEGAVKACGGCDGEVRPRAFESRSDWAKRQFCSRTCANNRPRSPRRAAA